jgi:hypothetical protein
MTLQLTDCICWFLNGDPRTPKASTWTASISTARKDMVRRNEGHDENSQNTDLI